MENIILQPCASADAQRHYLRTIVSWVHLDDIAAHMSPGTVQDLQRYAVDGELMVWGLTPAKDDSTVRLWEQLHNGTIAAFFADRKVFFTGHVCAKTRNAEVARQLWGSSGGQTWELLYFLNAGQKASFPLLELTNALRYSTDLVLRARVCTLTPSAEQVLRRHGDPSVGGPA